MKKILKQRLAYLRNRLKCGDTVKEEIERTESVLEQYHTEDGKFFIRF